MKQKLRLRVGISAINIWMAIKRVSFGLLLLVIGWIVYDVYIQHLMQGNRLDQAIAFIASWIIIAYILIPMIHRVLTKLYIPNYFIGRIRTVDGLLSDPVNLAFIGSENQLHSAMQAAGWVMSDNLTISSGIRMGIATLFRRSYPEAPVSSAFLFNERQYFTYQQSVNNKTLARHHVRFWKVPEGWFLPGGRKVDWLAAGTFDRSVGLSYFTLQLTHRIVSDTDIERDYIIDTLKTTKKIKKLKVIENYFSAYHHRNGGGDSIMTDGALPIIEL